MRRSLFTLLLAVGAGCAAPPLPRGVVDPPPDPFAAEFPPPRLAPGDVVRVTVFGHPELSTPPEGQALDFQGRLILPLVEPLAVRGLAVDEVRSEVTGALARYLREPRVSVALVSSAERVFYVYGEVESPGVKPLPRPLTALQALALAGAPRPEADLETVALLRGGRDDLEVHFFDARSPGPDGLFPVLPGDFIFVRRSRAGTFKQQILPVVQSFVPPLSALAGLVLAAKSLD